MHAQKATDRNGFKPVNDSASTMRCNVTTPSFSTTEPRATMSFTRAYLASRSGKRLYVTSSFQAALWYLSEQRSISKLRKAPHSYLAAKCLDSSVVTKAPLGRPSTSAVPLISGLPPIALSPVDVPPINPVAVLRNVDSAAGSSSSSSSFEPPSLFSCRGPVALGGFVTPFSASRMSRACVTLSYCRPAVSVCRFVSLYPAFFPLCFCSFKLVSAIDRSSRSRISSQA